MNKNFVKWILSTLSLACAAFSLVLVFSSVAKAVCTISQTCANGAAVHCSGDACQHTSTSVTCTQSDGSKISRHCPSGGGGDFEPELPPQS